MEAGTEAQLDPSKAPTETNPFILTDKTPKQGNIPAKDLQWLLEFTTREAEVVAKIHTGLNKLLPEFKENLGKAFATYVDLIPATKEEQSSSPRDKEEDTKLIEKKANPYIAHEDNVKALLKTVKKMEKVVDYEKFKTPLFWIAITLSILVLSAGAVMLSMPVYIAAGFVCLIAGAISLIICALTMKSGQKTTFDKGFFGHCQDLAKNFNLPLVSGEDPLLRVKQ